MATAKVRFAIALMKCAWVIVVLGLGAILGILLLFKSGMYPGHMHYAFVVGSGIETKKTLYENLLLSQIVARTNRELFPFSIVTLSKKKWKEYQPSLRDEWLESTVNLTLTDAAPNSEVKPPIDKISRALGELASASRFPKWEVISVSANRDRDVSVKYRWNFKPNDIYSPGTDEILFDAMAWLGILPGSSNDTKIVGFPSNQ